MIEVERDEDRVSLHRGFLDDPRLSLRAKGLLAVLLSRRERTVDPVELIAAGERLADVEAALRHLEAAGYFVRAAGQTGLAGTARETTTLPLLQSVARPRAAGREAHVVAPADADEIRRGAERVLARLNELRRSSWTWAKYTPLSARHAKNVEHIRGRLHEGYAETDLVLVLEYLAAVDGGKDESRKYFDSVTPFNTKNFERNVAMARDWDARGRPRGDGSLALQRADGHDPTVYEQRVRGGGT